jgi:diguanylate cyclase (GGDEF)-like protein
MSLLCVWFTFAWGQAAPDPLEARLAHIEQVHVSEHWQVSQDLIDQLRAERPDLGTLHRTRLDVMEMRNFALRGMHTECIALADELLTRPVSLAHRLRALHLAMNCAQHLDRYELAFDYQGAALRLLPEIDDPAPKADILNMAARMHWEVGELATSLRYAAESLEFARSSDDLRSICDSYFTLTAAQFEASLLTAALQSSQETWERCQQAGDPVLIATSLELVGRVLSALGRHDEAIGWLRRAIDSYTHAAYDPGLGLARFHLAKALVETGQAAEAIDLLDAIAPIVDRVHSVSLADLADVRARAHAANAEWGAALDQLEQMRSHSTGDESDRIRRIAYLQAEFEAQRREQEIRLLREQNRVLQLAEEASAKRVRIQWVVGLSTATVALLLIGLLVSFRIDRRRFRRLSQYDGLTGLYNHRSFHQEVQEALRRLGARNAPAVLVAADVDLFKKINDRYGHQAGDRVLQHLGEVLREQFPPPCLLGRIGGEEFGIFVPDQNRLQVRQRIHALRSSLGAVEFQGRSIEFTLSFGLIESRGNARLETMRRRADEALYRAKRSGRDELIDAADLDPA